jgi:hypothetical protein
MQAFGQVIKLSYLCNGCPDALVAGQAVILKHVRGGRVLGQAQGHYNWLGGVDEDPIFRNEQEGNPNNRLEIFDSEYNQEDSSCFLATNPGQPYSRQETATLDDSRFDFMDLEATRILIEEWAHQHPPLGLIHSGIEAWHQGCYAQASEAVKDLHQVSLDLAEFA